jgi:hypothetical protein
VAPFTTGIFDLRSNECVRRVERSVSKKETPREPRGYAKRECRADDVLVRTSSGTRTA